VNSVLSCKSQAHLDKGLLCLKRRDLGNCECPAVKVCDHGRSHPLAAAALIVGPAHHILPDWWPTFAVFGKCGAFFTDPVPLPPIQDF
jgi:hypothetical protein